MTELKIYQQELRLQVEKLTEQSETDELTQFRNRRGLKNFGTSVVERRNRLTALMIDIDHFKTINDKYGHFFGDVVLQVVAELIRNNTRDVPFRYGGEEFLSLMRESTAEEGRIVGERLRSLTEALIIPAPDGSNIRITISVGVASGIADTPSAFNAIVKGADVGVYAAKNSGRNKVVVTDDAEVEKLKAAAMQAECAKHLVR